MEGWVLNEGNARAHCAEVTLDQSKQFKPFNFHLFFVLIKSKNMSTSLEKPQIIAHIQKSLNYTVFESKWIPCSAKFVCMGNLARGTGVIQIYEIQHGELQLVKEV